MRAALGPLDCGDGSERIDSAEKTEWTVCIYVTQIRNPKGRSRSFPSSPRRLDSFIFPNQFLLLHLASDLAERRTSLLRGEP